MATTDIAATLPVYRFMFSICTLVTDWNEYKAMRQSFENKCFTTDCCEYLVADNSKGNVFNAYTAINKFLSFSKAKYTILIHQDTLCLDNYATLLDVIKNMDAVDDKWAVCGNAGGVYPHKLFFYVRYAGTDKKELTAPQK